jgi:hypothetical protein
MLGNMFKWFTLYNAQHHPMTPQRVFPRWRKVETGRERFGNQTVDIMKESKKRLTYVFLAPTIEDIS